MYRENPKRVIEILGATKARYNKQMYIEMHQLLTEEEALALEQADGWQAVEGLTANIRQVTSNMKIMSRILGTERMAELQRSVEQAIVQNASAPVEEVNHDEVVGAEIKCAITGNAPKKPALVIRVTEVTKDGAVKSLNVGDVVDRATFVDLYVGGADIQNILVDMGDGVSFFSDGDANEVQHTIVEDALLTGVPLDAQGKAEDLFLIKDTPVQIYSKSSVEQALRRHAVQDYNYYQGGNGNAEVTHLVPVQQGHVRLPITRATVLENTHVFKINNTTQVTEGQKSHWKQVELDGNGDIINAPVIARQ